MPAASPTTVNFRYMVHDVDAAISWYTKHLGFNALSNAAPVFADVTLGSLRLLLGPTSSAGRPYLMALAPKQVAGTASMLSWMTFRARPHDCVPRACSSAMTS
jgi:hypothetical protein